MDTADEYWEKGGKLDLLCPSMSVTNTKIPWLAAGRGLQAPRSANTPERFNASK